MAIHVDFSDDTLFASYYRINRRIPSFCNEKKVYYLVETMPVFPGGEKVLKSSIHESICHIKQSKNIHKRGKVSIQFDVNEIGKADRIRVAKGIDEELDFFAQEIIRSLPNWESPGKIREKPVVVSFTIPIEF
jgi:protein TonB